MAEEGTVACMARTANSHSDSCKSAIQISERPQTSCCADNCYATGRVTHGVAVDLKTLTGQPDGRDVGNFKQTRFDLRDVVLASRTVKNNLDSSDCFEPSPKDLSSSVCRTSEQHSVQGILVNCSKLMVDFDQIHKHRDV